MHKPEQLDLVSSAEVATIFDVDVTTVNRWAKAGKLTPYVKGPGRTGANLYRRSDIEALLQRGAA